MRLLLLLTLLSLPGNARAADPARPWIELAHRKNLARDVGWLRLLHFRRDWLGLASLQSYALGDLFFLAPGGARDPEAELDATLRGFFRPMTAEEFTAAQASGMREAGRPDRQLPQCQFPARLLWLQRELGIPAGALPAQNCRRFEEFRRNVAAQSVTLIFSSYYLNNPSSAFGHTFLRLNKGQGGQRKEGADLLDYGINYAAVVDTKNAFLYAVKGLLGLFPGTFTSVPFYYKVREYSDYESRDLWEYELNLSAAQVDFLVAHLWELGSTSFRYFYFSKNCSYEILNLLDVADSSLHLMDDLPAIVIPGDTVRLLMSQPGLVKNVRYRPSLRTQFESRVRKLPGPGKDQLRRLLELLRGNRAFGETWPAFRSSEELTAGEQAELLDAALDYIDMEYNDELILPEKRAKSPAPHWKQELLIARSGIEVPALAEEVPVPAEKAPDKGHGSRRLTLDSGYNHSFGAFSTLQYRFTLHDLADPTLGYPDNAQIELGSFRVRYNYRPAKLWVDDVTLFRVVSLNPLTDFNHHFSWSVSLAGRRLYDGICPATCFGAGFDVGGGYALSLWEQEHLTFFLLGMAEVLAGPDFPGAHFRPGVGPTGGLIAHPSEALGLQLQAGYRRRFGSGVPNGSFVEGIARWLAGRNLALEGKFGGYPTGWETSGGLAYFH